MSTNQSEKLFLKEMKNFLFYSKKIWPLHRKWVGNKITARCQNCILSANISPLNSDGLCEECRLQKGDSSLESAIKDKHLKLSEEIHQFLLSKVGEGKYQHDAAVLFSGGKDSSYLVHHLQKTYPQLRLVLITIDNTFMSPFAIKNIESLVQKFDIEHQMIRPPAYLYNKMFRHAFLNLNAKGCSGTVDQFDGDFFHDIGRNFAATNHIPLLISGCSKTQVEHILGIHHYLSPVETESMPRKSVAGIQLNDLFTNDEMRYWWQGGDPKHIPKVIFPFYAWNFDEQFIIQKVIELGILPPYSSSPLLTNNQLIPLMCIVDMIKYGYSSFEKEFAKMARSGKTDPVFWRNIFELSEYSAKTGHFISQTVDESLKRLNITRKQLGIPQ